MRHTMNNTGNTEYFSRETMQARKQQKEMFKVLGENVDLEFFILWKNTLEK